MHSKMRRLHTSLAGIAVGAIGLVACSATQPQMGYAPSVINVSYQSSGSGGHISISTEHPAMMEPVSIRSDKYGHLFGTSTNGKTVAIHPSYTLPITKNALKNKPAPIIPFKKKPMLERSGVRMGPDNQVNAHDDGGQVGYKMPSGSESGVGDIYSAHEANDTVTLYPPAPSDPFGNQWLYAPTTHGPNGNCLEIVTAYQAIGSNPRAVWIYNFCDNGGTFEGGIPMDQNFYNSYVRTFTNGNGRPEYTEEVDYGTDNQWHFLLANYTTGVFDDKADYSGMSQVLGGEGWSIFETHYTTGPCSDVPSLSMSGLRLHYSHTKGQDWRYANESGYQYGPFGECFPPDTGPQGTFYYTNAWNNSDYGWFSYTNPS